MGELFLEREWQSMIIMSTFFILSLIGAVVLFYFLESYAEVTNPSYRLGGAAAGFVVFFITLVGSYSRVVAKPASRLMRDAGRAITKPKGFREYILPENGFSIYYPEKWTTDRTDNFPEVMLRAEDGTNVILGTCRVEKEFMVEYEKDPSQFPVLVETLYGSMFRDFVVLEKRTIALHGKHFPMFITENIIEGNVIKHVQVAYFDAQAEKLHWITFSVLREKYEEMKPIWEKMLSTFHILET